MRRRSGFTLIELLVVVLIIGILASMSISKFGDAKRRGFIAAMKSDLRNLATTAETRYAADNSYAGLLAPQGSAGVTISVTSSAHEWTGSATHSGVPGMTCTIASAAVAGQPSRPQPDCQ